MKPEEVKAAIEKGPFSSGEAVSWNLVDRVGYLDESRDYVRQNFGEAYLPAEPIRYKSKLLTCAYRADFVCFESVIVETKAIAMLTSADEAQLINELKATGLQRGLLLNFGAESLEYKRPVLNFSENLRQSAEEAYL